MENGTEIRHTQTVINGLDTHIASAGNADSVKSIVFLHGWPEDWSAFEPMMRLASHDYYYCIAIDLPGIGKSTSVLKSGSKLSIARHIRTIIETLKLSNVTIVGHDVGGMITYACLRLGMKELRSAVIMDVVIPGLDPWEKALKNPHLWHFAFHAIPKLPEELVSGKQKEYFNYFYETIAAHPDKINTEKRGRYATAYTDPEALESGFNWYRSFQQDAEQNSRETSHVTTPLLYIRGDEEGGDINDYVNGLHKAGVKSVSSALIANAGHFTPEEQPLATWKEVRSFAS